MDGVTELVYATAIALDGTAALVRGPSGAGKSDLALRCLSLAPCGLVAVSCQLVADDQVRLSRQGKELVVTAPATIAGRMEVRGLGIVEVPHAAQATLRLVVELVPPTAVPRFPDPTTVPIMGIEMPLLLLTPFEASAPLKLLVALDALRRGKPVA